MRRQIQRPLFGEPEWSENIIVLGKGTPNWSRKYRRVVYCIAGIGEASGWLRLYPVEFETDEPIGKFDVIQTVFRKHKPEKLRPESRKVYIGLIKKVDRIADNDSQRKFLCDNTDSGSFLHDKSWNGVKTLGIIKPLNPRFWVTKGKKLKVKYDCDAPNCTRHHNDVYDFTKVNRVGRKTLFRGIEKDEFEKNIRKLESHELRFVMGTHSKYPSKWILISIHNLGSVWNKWR